MLRKNVVSRFHVSPDLSKAKQQACCILWKPRRVLIKPQKLYLPTAAEETGIGWMGDFCSEPTPEGCFLSGSLGQGRDRNFTPTLERNTQGQRFLWNQLVLPTVDETNPAPRNTYCTTMMLRVSVYQVIQDFNHQRRDLLVEAICRWVVFRLVASIPLL